jgi:hypothetical protein
VRILWASSHTDSAGTDTDSTHALILQKQQFHGDFVQREANQLTLLEHYYGELQIAMQAIQQNDSSEAMRALEELQYDLSNINGNVTNLQFTVAAEPP